MVECTSSSELSLGPGITVDLMVFLRDVDVSSRASPLEFCLETLFAASPVIVFLLPRPVDLKTSGLSTGKLEHKIATLSSVSVHRAAETLFHVGSVAIDAARRVGRRIIETMHTLFRVLDLIAKSQGQALHDLQESETKNRKKDYSLSPSYWQFPYARHWEQKYSEVCNEAHS